MNTLLKLKKSFLCLATLTFMGCAHQGENRLQKDLFFITGAHLDETSWSRVINNIDAKKYSSFALPRTGRNADDPKHLKQIAEMACEKIKQPAVVIAHSFGGAIANEIIGTCPEKVSKVIYVSALVPLNNEHPTDVLKGADQKHYMAAVNIEKDRMTPKSKIGFALALDSEVKVAESQLPNVFSESMLNYGDIITFDPLIFNKIPKYYIYTNLDKIVTMDSQLKMTARLQLAGSEKLSTGHLPMISDPEHLAKTIEKFSQGRCCDY